MMTTTKGMPFASDSIPTTSTLASTAGEVAIADSSARNTARAGYTDGACGSRPRHIALLDPVRARPSHARARGAARARARGVRAAARVRSVLGDHGLPTTRHGIHGPAVLGRGDLLGARDGRARGRGG